MAWLYYLIKGAVSLTIFCVLFFLADFKRRKAGIDRESTETVDVATSLD